MKNWYLIIVIFIFSCDKNFYGDKNLGGDFYYMVEPAFNSIVMPLKQEEPYKGGTYVIENIEELGFNKEYILVSAKKKDSIEYFLIDKSAESNRDYIDRLKSKTNLVKLNFKKFQDFKKEYNIQTKTKEEYLKEDGWK
ncbi:MAG: hypothetical protein ACPGU6_05795 [Tenacibaculum sp.]